MLLVDILIVGMKAPEFSQKGECLQHITVCLQRADTIQQVFTLNSFRTNLFVSGFIDLDRFGLRHHHGFRFVLWNRDKAWLFGRFKIRLWYRDRDRLFSRGRLFDRSDRYRIRIPNLGDSNSREYIFPQGEPLLVGVLFVRIKGPILPQENQSVKRPVVVTQIPDSFEHESAVIILLHFRYRFGFDRRYRFGFNYHRNGLAWFWSLHEICWGRAGICTGLHTFFGNQHFPPDFNPMLVGGLVVRVGFPVFSQENESLQGTIIVPRFLGVFKYTGAVTGTKGNRGFRDRFKHDRRYDGLRHDRRRLWGLLDDNLFGNRPGKSGNRFCFRTGDSLRHQPPGGNLLPIYFSILWTQPAQLPQDQQSVSRPAILKQGFGLRHKSMDVIRFRILQQLIILHYRFVQFPLL